jgi:hypothetical protein
LAAQANAKDLKMNLLFHAPSLGDLISLLKAWRFWLLAAFVGGLLAAAIYFLAPPPYRARATVNVDFNLEQAWPQETDRQQFYYLERETRVLEEIAWSDNVLKVVADTQNVSVAELRDSKLTLSQPAEAGWHFYADDPIRQRAAGIASAWAKAFTEQATAQVGKSDGLNSFIKMEVTQSADLPVKRSVSLGVYLLTGVFVSMLVSAMGVLFFTPGAEKE